VIVIVGSPWARLERGGVVAAGLAVSVGRAAAASGATVQLVGRIGEGPLGDGVIVDLGRAGIGHVASLRAPVDATALVVASSIDPDRAADTLDLADLVTETDDDLAGDGGGAGDTDTAVMPSAGSEANPTAGPPALEAADLDLALRYLGDIRVVVVTEVLDDAAARTIADAAAYVGAAVVALVTEQAGSGTRPAALGDAIVIERPAADPDDAFARLVGGLAAALDRGDAPENAFRSAVTAAGWERSEA
jgi:hypothetical protein